MQHDLASKAQEYTIRVVADCPSCASKRREMCPDVGCVGGFMRTFARGRVPFLLDFDHGIL